MGKKMEYTPNGKIKAALRMVFLRSRERAKRLKADGYCCQRCGIKQSKAKGREVKVEVHNRDGVCNWAEIYEAVRKNLLNVEEMETLCAGCHDKEHGTDEATKVIGKNHVGPTGL